MVFPCDLFSTPTVSLLPFHMKIFHRLVEWINRQSIAIACENLRQQRDTCRRIICEFSADNDRMRVKIDLLQRENAELREKLAVVNYVNTTTCKQSY